MWVGWKAWMIRQELKCVKTSLRQWLLEAVWLRRKRKYKCSYRNGGKGRKAGSVWLCCLGQVFFSPSLGIWKMRRLDWESFNTFTLAWQFWFPHALGKCGEELTRSGKVMPLPHIAKLWITIRPRTYNNPWELQVIGREFLHPCTIWWPCTLAPRPWPTHAQQWHKWTLHFICLSVQRRQSQQ